MSDIIKGSGFSVEIEPVMWEVIENGYAHVFFNGKHISVLVQKSRMISYCMKSDLEIDRNMYKEIPGLSAVGIDRYANRTRLSLMEEKKTNVG